MSLMIPLPQRSTLFPYTTLFRSAAETLGDFSCRDSRGERAAGGEALRAASPLSDRAHSSEHQHGQHESMGTNRSEEHTSELQSRLHIVCRLLLEKKKR